MKTPECQYIVEGWSKPGMPGYEFPYPSYDEARDKYDTLRQRGWKVNLKRITLMDASCFNKEPA